MELYQCPFCKKEIEVTRPNVISNHFQWQCKEWQTYKKEILTKEFLYNEHWVNGKSCNEIAHEHGIRSSCSVNKLMNAHGIGTRSIKESKKEKRCKDKTETTNLERHGAKHNFCKEHTSRKEWTQRLLDDENITNVFQREDVKRKIIAHHIEVYGFASHMQSPVFTKKFFDNYEESHGYRYPIQSPNNKFGGNVSKLQQKINNELLKLGYETKTEYNVYPYRVDIFIKNTNKVIEAYGDYWHANPRKYKENDVIKFPRNSTRTVVDIWTHDKNRISYIEAAGYKTCVVWEYDINKNFEETINNIINFINN
ncbi:MAG: hypothetical protein WC979_02200 [Candidatus Pacearchaeota archaeon]|jgi:G:T-mismatch repair DNA endonuclease (very short patch repair protein)|nr:hypothetical protein [Clostridia bacterium]